MLQYEGLAIATGAFLLTEVALYLTFYANPNVRFLFLPTVIPTFWAAVMIGNTLFTWTRLVVTCLSEPTPTNEELSERLRKCNRVKEAATIELSNHLMALNAYYTCIVRDTKNPISKFQWRGTKVELSSLALLVPVGCVMSLILHYYPSLGS